MANIVIKDLQESIDLDRKAMVAIIGGSRAGGRQHVLWDTIFRTNKIVNYPPGITRNPLRGKGTPHK